MLNHWVIPLSHKALPTELSHYHWVSVSIKLADRAPDFSYFSHCLSVCLWLDFGLPPWFPQVVRCHWREIELFSARSAPDYDKMWLKNISTRLCSPWVISYTIVVTSIVRIWRRPKGLTGRVNKCLLALITWHLMLIAVNRWVMASPTDNGQQVSDGISYWQRSTGDF